MNGTTRLHAIACLAALSVGGCGDSLTVERVNALGSVGGLVIDAETRLPLEGVSIGVLAGGQRFDGDPTDADGWFSVTSVPAGEVLVTMQLEGYQDAWVRKLIPSNAGEFPSGNAAVTVGPIGLVSVGQPLSVRVLDQSGAPAGAYELSMLTFAQYVDFTDGAGASAGETLSIATTDSEGYARFTVAPNFYRLGPLVDDTVIFLLPPRDGDGDGVNEFPGGSQTVSWRSLNDPTPDILLDPGLGTVLQVRASTIPGLVTTDGTAAAAVVERNGSLHVSFNLPIDAGAVVSVTDEQGEPLSSAPFVSVRDDTLTISFASAPLDAGRRYNLQMHVSSTLGEQALTSDLAAPFFTRSTSGAITATLSPAGADYVVEFSEPIGIGQGSSIDLSGANCVLFFEEDLNGSGAIGDASNEYGSANCTIPLVANEPAAPGLLSGLSGYTRFWRFRAPLLVGGVPMPSGTKVHVIFSRVSDSSLVITRPDGRLVSDFTGGAALVIP